LYGDDYRVAPLSVVVDPHRCARVLGLAGGGKFSEKVLYVYRKQLEEAEILVVNKIDLLDADARRTLLAALNREFPHAEVREVSCVTGEGLESWFDRVTTGGLGGRRSMDVDYDEYAEGEALLGWLNARAGVAAALEFDGNAFLLDLTRRLRQKLADKGIEIAHLKTILTPDEGPDLGSVSLTRNDESPHATHSLQSPLSRGMLMVNLRAEADPERLEQEVTSSLKSSPSMEFNVEEIAAFRPGRPTPTHRYADVSA
jgi:G3E family GTPase